MGMKKLAALLLPLLLVACHGHGMKPGHPHGAPPGQVKKAYRCVSCGVTKGAPGSCHGAALILVP